MKVASDIGLWAPESLFDVNSGTFLDSLAGFSTRSSRSKISIATKAKQTASTASYPSLANMNPPTTGATVSADVWQIIEYAIIFPKRAWPKVSSSNASPADQTMAPARPCSIRLMTKRMIVLLRANMNVAPSMRNKPIKRRELLLGIWSVAQPKIIDPTRKEDV